MLARQSRVILEDPSDNSRQAIHPVSLLQDESALLRDVILKSRPGASAYLLKIKEHLQQSRQFLEFLQAVRAMQDKR
jgi:hypothetical protein